MSQHILERTRYFLALGDQAIITIPEREELENIIGEHNRRYYIDAAPIISDGEYDHLYRLLVLAHGGDNRYVDDFFERFRSLLSRQFVKGAHNEPMISLANTYNAIDLGDFAQRIINISGESASLQVVAELKLDGLGLSLLYRDGQLVRALTRGNGQEGEDVTVNVQGLIGVPQGIPYTQEIEVRGEIIFPKSAFERLNEERAKTGEKLFANPRNAASGTLRQLDTLQAKERGLEFYAYTSEMSKIGISADNTYQGLLALFRSWGFQISPYAEIFRSIQDFSDICESLVYLKESFDFEIDGLVIKLNDMTLWSELGLTAHHPRYAIAYKFPTQEATTKLLDVEHSVGRSGVVTPVAILDPVGLGGVTISRATLHNYDEVLLKDVRIGDQIFIKRAGEVIPDVVAPIIDVRTGDEMTIVPPKVCPSCGHILAREEGKVAIFCPNRPQCPAQRLGMLEVFVSKHAANIEGLGTKIIEIFYEKGYLTDIVSIYHLFEHRDELMCLEGFGLKKVDNILSEIEKSRSLSLERFLISLAIPLVGRRSAQTLSQFLVMQGVSTNAGFIGLMDEISSAEIQEKFLLIDDLGPQTLLECTQFFTTQRVLVASLLQEIHLIFPSIRRAEHDDGGVSGKAFCVTGSFDSMSRDEIHTWIESRGGFTRTSVSKELDYLIVGAKAGSKAEKAEKLGVTIISLDELIGLGT